MSFLRLFYYDALYYRAISWRANPPLNVLFYLKMHYIRPLGHFKCEFKHIYLDMVPNLVFLFYHQIDSEQSHSGKLQIRSLP